MAAPSTAAQRWSFWIDARPRGWVQRVTAGLALAEAGLLALLVWILATVHVAWLRAPLVLVTGGLLGAGGLLLGAALYELRRRPPASPENRRMGEGASPA